MATTLYPRHLSTYGSTINDPGMGRGVWTTDLDNATNTYALFASTSRGSAAVEAGLSLGVGGWVGQKLLGGSLGWSGRYGYTTMVTEDVTISGSITVNVRARENTMTDNITIGIIIQRRTTDFVLISTVANSEFGTELGTTDAAKNWSITPTSTNFTKGDILAFIFVAADAGTTGVGAVGYISYDGPTAGAAGDSYVTFTETFGTTDPVILRTRSLQIPQLIAQ